MILTGGRQRHRASRPPVLGFGAEYAGMIRHVVPSIIETKPGSAFDED